MMDLKTELMNAAFNRRLSVREFDWELRGLQLFTRQEEITIIEEYRHSDRRK